MTLKQKIFLKSVVGVLLTILVVYVLFIVASFIAAYASTRDEVTYWANWQREYIAALEKSYRSRTAPKVNEQDFCDFNLSEALSTGVKINELKMLATHNSYKQGTTAATNVFYNYALPVLLGKKYDYTFDTITQQLNYGIRSIEIDLGKVKTDNGFEIRVYHNALTEAGSSMINFELGLKELKMWSDYNPAHLPVFVLVETKKGSFGAYESFDEESLRYVDNLLEEVLGDKLFTPADAIGNNGTFENLRKNNDYPTLKNMLGKFVFLFHETYALDDYVSLDETAITQNMFIALSTENSEYSSPEYMNRCLFLIINYPNVEKEYAMIEQAVKDNFIVRTRLDEYAMINSVRHDKAIESGANILSTDYPPASTDRYGYTASINASGKTILLARRNAL